MRLSAPSRDSKEHPASASLYSSPSGLSHRRQKGSATRASGSGAMDVDAAASSGGGAGAAMPPAAAAAPTGDAKHAAGLQSLVHRSNAKGQAEAQAVAVPPKAAGKEADDDDSVAENKGCWACLCRCWHSKSATAPSQITVSPIRSPSLRGLLPPASKENQGKKCLVLDLDETLVHSSFKPIPRPDYVIPVEIDRNVHHVYVRKRPGCDLFLRALAPHYEIVVFTASLAKYADPLLDKLDIYNVISYRLFREACVFHEGNYVKDMRLLGRPIQSSIIVDNSPASYLFQPENAIPCDSFIEDPRDRELLDLIPYLESIVSVPDVRDVLHQWCSPGPGTVLGPDPTSGFGQGSNPEEADGTPPSL